MRKIASRGSSAARTSKADSASRSRAKRILREADASNSDIRFMEVLAALPEEALPGTLWTPDSRPANEREGVS
jgi:hypothetical protein